MSFPFNITNPGINIPGLLTTVEQAFVTNLVSLPYVTGDILYYDGSALTRLAIGAASRVLTVSGGLPSWQVPATGFADPLTTNGDIIARIAGATTRLPQGGNGTFLGVSGGTLGYYTPSGAGLVDSDYGDIVVSGSGTIMTIDTNVVGLTKLAQIATDSILGRATAATGNVEVLTALPFAFTGDVTRAADSNAQTIAASAVTLAKMADVATASVFYRKTAGTGAPEVQTLATLKTDLGLTGTNSGDQTSIVGITGTKAQFNTAVSDGDILYVGDITQYTDELAQDAVGAMIDTSLVYVDATPLLTRAALTGAITASQGSNTTALGSFTKAQLDTAVSDGNVLYVGDVTQYTDEQAQDAVGAMLNNSTFITLTYVDATPTLTATLSATGTPSSSTYLRGDNTWATVAGGGNTFNDTYIDQSGGTSDTYGVLSGTINGSNAVFTVSQSLYATGALKVWLNGQLMTQGSAEDFVETTPASGTFTFNTAPATGSLITVEYRKVVTNSDTIVTTTTVNELAQDAIGLMVDSTLIYVDATPLITRAALTGDITAPQASNVTTLATVNANVGSFGSATQVAGFTVNGKGLITAASNTSIQIAESQVTNLVTDLSAKEATANKDTSGGYAGLTLFKLNMRNVANTFTSFFTNTNTASRTYTLKDADGTIAFTSDITGTNSGTNTGDVTLAGTPNYITIAGQVITRALIDLTTHVTGKLPFANIVDVATATVMYRKTAGTGSMEAQTLATLKTDLGLTGTNSGDQTITLTSDVTGSGTGSFATTIANNVVSNAKLAQIATATFKGRITAATGNVEDLTGTQATTLLDTFTTSLKGLAPASGGGTTNYLRADGTWAAPGGSGTVTNVSSANADIIVATPTTTPVLTMVQTPALRSATTTVNVSSATAPTTGQVLTAISSTAATWQTPAAGGGLTQGQAVALFTGYAMP